MLESGNLGNHVGILPVCLGTGHTPLRFTPIAFADAPLAALHTALRDTYCRFGRNCTRLRLKAATRTRRGTVGPFRLAPARQGVAIPLRDEVST